MGGKRVVTTIPKIEDGDPEAERAEQERLAADLQHLRDLLEADWVPEARRFVKELEQQWPEAERVRHYARVLEPPKVGIRKPLCRFTEGSGADMYGV